MNSFALCLTRFAVGFILLCTGIGRAGDPPPDTLREPAIADLKLLVETTRRAWAYAEDKRENFGVDLEQLSSLAESRIRSCRDKEEAFEILRDVVCGLKDGHASLRLREQSGSAKTGRIKGNFRQTREGLVFERQLILRWNGRDPQEELASLTAHVFASTPGMARQLALGRLARGPLNQVAHARLKSSEGSERDQTLRFEPEIESRLRPLELRWPHKEIAHLVIRTFDVRRPGWE